jgi:hypothetical protein
MVGSNELILCQEEMCRAMNSYLHDLLTPGEKAWCTKVSVRRVNEDPDAVFIIEIQGKE